MAPGQRGNVLKIHTADGQTHRVDLGDEKQAKEWLSRLRDRSFQDSVTGISVIQDCHGRIRCTNCKKTGSLACKACGSAMANDAYTKIGVQYSLSRPDGYGPVFYSVDKIDPEPDSKVRGGERVTCFAGDSRISMMVHAGQPSVRVTLLKTGKQRYNPLSD